MTRRIDPHTLAQAPELAALVALEKLLWLATRVLVAEHPTLSHYDPLCRRTEPPTLREARRILRDIAPLQQDFLQRHIEEHGPSWNERSAAEWFPAAAGASRW